MQGKKIPGFKKMSSSKKIGVYTKPSHVYIPLINQNDDNITLLVKKGDYVYKGSILGKRKGVFRIPILSSVSGTVVDFVERHYTNGELIKCVVIENDFKEAMLSENKRKDINNITKDEFINIVRDCGIVGMGGSGFPTYVKYDTDKKIKTLIVNAVECEPYITADYALLMEHCEEILEAIDAILDINNIDEAIVAVKGSNTNLVKVLENNVGSYLRIKVSKVPNLYPMGWEKNLVRFVKGVNYNSLPSEKGIIVQNVATIYAIYQALKYGRPLVERVITITGEKIKNPQNVLVKVGTPVSEVIEIIGGYKKYKDTLFIAGGPMMGMSLPNDDLVVSPNLNCVLVLYDKKEEIATQCLRCGKCVEFCPAKLSPVMIKDNINHPERLKELRPERCISCGLCAKMCPAHTITLANGNPIWNEKCYQCLKCINYCPKEAIQYGDKTSKRGRYNIEKFIKE